MATYSCVPFLSFHVVSVESGHVPSTTLPPPMPSYCLTSNGHRYEEGDGWHDGCRDCYCHSGREMCVLITCPVPSCSHPVVKHDQCCPTCEGMSDSNIHFLYTSRDRFKFNLRQQCRFWPCSNFDYRMSMKQASTNKQPFLVILFGRVNEGE